MFRLICMDCVKCVELPVLLDKWLQDAMWTENCWGGWEVVVVFLKYYLRMHLEWKRKATQNFSTEICLNVGLHMDLPK
jgi:hypothetical protein